MHEAAGSVAAEAPRTTAGERTGLEARADLPCPMTLAEELRAQLTEARRVSQRQLAAVERGHFDHAFGVEQMASLGHAIQAGIAIYDGLLARRGGGEE